MNIKVIEGPEAFDLGEWQTLLALDPNRSIFSTPQWQRLWWEEFGNQKHLITLLFCEPDPVALATMMIDETDAGKRIRFVGGDDLTDYLGPLVAHTAPLQSVAESLLEYLSTECPGWDYFKANCLPVPFGFAEWLVAAADRRGMPFQVEESELTAVMPLPSTFHEYLAGLSQKKRHELRRKLRRFEREIPQAKLRRATAETLERDMETFVDMHRGSEGLKGKFMQPQRATFFTRAASELEPLGWLSLDFLESEGATMASTFSFRFENTFYLYNSAYDHAQRDISPGLILVIKLIERAIEEKMDRFDFLRGRERYKFDLGAEALPLNAVRIQNRRR